MHESNDQKNDTPDGGKWFHSYILIFPGRSVKNFSRGLLKLLAYYLSIGIGTILNYIKFKKEVLSQPPFPFNFFLILRS